MESPSPRPVPASEICYRSLTIRRGMNGREASPPRGKRTLPRTRPRYANLCVKIAQPQKQWIAERVASSGRSEGEIVRDILQRAMGVMA